MAVIPPIGSMATRKYLMLSVVTIQIVILILFAVFVDYKSGEDYKLGEEAVNYTASYMMFSDTHVMIIVGFGYLMTFMKRYMFGGVGFNFLLSALMMQWAIIMQGFFKFKEGSWRVGIHVEDIEEADVATAAVLISMGAVLGRTTYLQLLYMGLFEMAIQTALKQVNETWIIAADGGESMFVHAFGAYFGLAVSYILNKYSKYKPQPDDMASSYNSDTFAMIGTVFLWIYWPSFNAASQEDVAAKYRAVINTYLALTSSTVMAFACSWLFSSRNKFDMVHVQNATLAGGVAVGAVSNLIIYPAGAGLIGFAAGLISVVGYIFLTPKLENIGIPDTCGVNNLHGMPGVMSGLISIGTALLATNSRYGGTLSMLWPAMRSSPTDGVESYGRDTYTQAGFQLAALAVTLTLAIIGGLIVGLVISSKFCDPWNGERKSHDKSMWEIHDQSVTPEYPSVTVTPSSGHPMTPTST